MAGAGVVRGWLQVWQMLVGAEASVSVVGSVNCGVGSCLDLRTLLGGGGGVAGCAAAWAVLARDPSVADKGCGNDCVAAKHVAYVGCVDELKTRMTYPVVDRLSHTL